MAFDRFDSIARTISALVSRRTVMGGVTGALLALANLEQGADAPVEAAQRRRKPRKKKCPKKRRCRSRCCPSGKVCRGGACRTPTPPPPPPPPRSVIVRVDMHDNGPALAAYATAVGVMKQRNGDDPTSWEFQAGLHRAAPVGGNGCQHSTVLFLAWHRMYLYWFERVLRAASGDPSMGLPYWDYGVASKRIVPEAFRNPASPLYAANRNAEVNNGLPPTANPASFSATTALSQPSFYSNDGASFAGGDVRGGSLETIPHNFIHTWVGGDMAGVPTAGLDPLFWVHHANIDRLWEVWLRQGEGRANPTDVALFMNTPFTFFDEQGAARQMTGAQILDPITQLGYRYDDQPLSSAGMGTMRAASRRRQPKQTIIGATKRGAPVRLTAQPVTVPISIRPAAATALAAKKRPARRTTLSINGLVGHTTAGVVFEVYVNVPKGQAVRPTSRSYVGSFTLFGAQPGDMPGHQMSIATSFDITRAIAAPGGADQRVVVKIVPRDVDATGGLPAGTLATIEQLVFSVEGAIAGTKQTAGPPGRKKRKPARVRPKPRRKARPAQQRRSRRAQGHEGHLTGNQEAVVPGNKLAVFNRAPVGSDNEPSEQSPAHH